MTNLSRKYLAYAYFGCIASGFLAFIAGFAASSRLIRAGADEFMGPAFIGTGLFSFLIVLAMVILVTHTEK